MGQLTSNTGSDSEVTRVEMYEMHQTCTFDLGAFIRSFVHIQKLTQNPLLCCSVSCFFPFSYIFLWTENDTVGPLFIFQMLSTSLASFICVQAWTKHFKLKGDFCTSLLTNSPLSASPPSHSLVTQFTTQMRIYSVYVVKTFCHIC